MTKCEESDDWGLLQFLLAAFIGFDLVSVVSAQPAIQNIATMESNKNESGQGLSSREIQPDTQEAILDDFLMASVDLEQVLYQEPAAAESKPIKSKAAAELRKITAVGDSVMLGARDSLLKEIGNIKVDAVVSRQFTEVENIIADLKKKGQLTPIVIIHTGNNGTVDEKLFRRMMESLRDCQMVIVLNVRVPKSWQQANNEIFSRIVPQYANAILIDWQKASSGKAEYFYKDGIHLKPQSGTDYYASLVKKALSQG